MTITGLYALLIVTDSELKMTRNDTLLLVVPRGVACKLENLGSKVFKDSGKVDCEAVSRSCDYLRAIGPGAPVLTWLPFFNRR